MQNAMGVTDSAGGKGAAARSAPLQQLAMPLMHVRRAQLLQNDETEVRDDLLFGQLAVTLLRLRRELRERIETGRTS